MKILKKSIIKKSDSLELDNGTTIMHVWETPIMQQMVNFICQDGGDILEVGFGMGISADLIQKHAIKSHHIIEIHPTIYKDLEEWSKDKFNVDTLNGDWYANRDKLKKYDGIFFDTHLDINTDKFKNLLPQICNDGCKITWWNNSPFEYNELKLPGVEFEILHVNPPKNKYFNHTTFYMPKYIHHV
jgi:protein-L-isoaspartate O-methyltransferase